MTMFVASSLLKGKIRFIFFNKCVVAYDHTSMFSLWFFGCRERTTIPAQPKGLSSLGTWSFAVTISRAQEKSKNRESRLDVFPSNTLSAIDNFHDMQSLDVAGLLSNS